MSIHQHTDELPDTPKQLIVSGLIRRFLAVLVDVIILEVLGMILGFFLFDFFVNIGVWGRLIGFTISLLYFGILESTVGGGQSAGKRLARIRVADSNGNNISPLRSFVRFTTIGIPYFLNGAAIPVYDSIVISYIDWLIVFGGWGAIIYLFVFNRRTRQSLHDLVAGAFVIPSAPQGKSYAPRIWKGHFAIIIIFLISIVSTGVVIAPKLMQYGPFQDLLELQKNILASDNEYFATVEVRKTTQIGKDSNADYLQVGVLLKKEPTDYDKVLSKIAAIVLSNYPKIKEQDFLAVSASYGFDIGIASSRRSRKASLSPNEWEQTLHMLNKTEDMTL